MAIKPTVQSSTSGVGLQIEYPNNPYFKEGDTFKLHFHVFNSSNFALNTSQVSCNIHVYNQTNSHIIKQDLSDDTNGIDKYITIYPSNLTGVYEYPYILYCNSSKEQGFLASTFILTDENQSSNLLNFIIAIGIILFLLIYFANNIGEEHGILKLLCYIYVFVMMILIPLSFMYGVDNVVLFYRIILTLLSLFFAYIFFYYVYKLLVYLGVMK